MMKRLVLIISVCIYSCTVSAQDVKSILSGVVKSVVGDKATTAVSVIGEWNYSAPDCQLKSENVLTQAGGEAISQQIEGKLESVYQVFGLKDAVFTFNEDGTFSLAMKKRTTTGTYVFDSKEKTLTMKTKLGISLQAHVAVLGKSMSLLFEADKLMTALKVLTSVTSKKSSGLDSLLEKYDGLLLGIQLTKK